MTPAECRESGVAVKDSDTITGTIVTNKATSLGGVYKGCGDGAAACTVAIEGGFPSGSHQYAIYYTNDCDGRHEQCHSQFEEYNHTIEYNISSMQGDIFASCP